MIIIISKKTYLPAQMSKQPHEKEWRLTLSTAMDSGRTWLRMCTLGTFLPTVFSRWVCLPTFATHPMVSC